MANAKLDENSRPTITGLSNADGSTIVVPYVDPSTHRLLVEATGTLTGAQYTEGDADASITGTVAMMEVGSDTLQPVQGTVADGLLVNLGSNNDVIVSGVSTAAKQDTIIGHLDGVEG